MCRKRMKRLAAGIAMILLMALASQSSFAQAGDEIIHIDFDDGSMCGFETYIEGGDCTLRNEDGRLAVDIASCGELDYANQAYWDGFSLEKDCTYNYSFDVSCSIDREIEYRLQLNGGDYHAYVNGFISIGQEPEHISVDWTMAEESDPAPRLAFNMGYEQNMTEDPGAHTVWIDNISLTVLDGSAKASQDEQDSKDDENENGGIVLSINQAGYRPADVKTVFIRCGDADGSDPNIPDLSVVDESGSSVMELAAEEPFYDEASGARMQRADFSGMTQPGTYRIRAVSGESEVLSEPFEIEEDPYDSIQRSAFQMLYLQRCGTEVSLRDEPEAEMFAHGICHNTPALIYGTDRTKDVSGGWHDAGDYGRYVVSGAKAVADLFLAYEQFGFVGDDMEIPESGNGVPDVLDEARWELEWMLKMQEESGGVYHKVTCRSFPGEVKPEEETGELVISPVSLTATLDFAAVMAKASTLYSPYDPDFAAATLDAAQRAWAYANEHENDGGFHNPSDISTGEYLDEDAKDEFLWAAAELYLTGRPETEEAQDSTSSQEESQDNNPGQEEAQDNTSGQEETQNNSTGQESAQHTPNQNAVQDILAACQTHGLGWQCVSDYALIDLALAKRSEDTLREEAKERLAQYGASLLELAEKDGYYMTLGPDYPWGSNMTVSDRGNLMLLVERLTGEERYAEIAKRQLDYLLGANPTAYCYVTGTGSFSPEHPHHRPSQAAGSAMPGMLVGGPNSHLEDPYAQNVLSGNAPALCYADNSQSYSTNETAVYWNSPLITLLSGIIKEE